MMCLSQKIIYLYPDITMKEFGLSGTIVIQNDADGRGDYIATWNRSEPKPTQEQLDALND